MWSLPVEYHRLSRKARREVRLQYVELQGGLCQYCQKPLDGPPAEEVGAKPVGEGLFPPGFFKWPVHLHHDKQTGMTIGAVHCYCNAVSFQYEELPRMEEREGAPVSRDLRGEADMNTSNPNYAGAAETYNLSVRFTAWLQAFRPGAAAAPARAGITSGQLAVAGPRFMLTFPELSSEAAGDFERFFGGGSAMIVLPAHPEVVALGGPMPALQCASVGETVWLPPAALTKYAPLYVPVQVTARAGRCIRLRLPDGREVDVDEQQLSTMGRI